MISRPGKEGRRKGENKVKILATQHNPNESLLFITLDEIARLARKFLLSLKELVVYDV